MTRVQILDEAVCVSHSTNAREKILIPKGVLPAIGKSWDRLGSLALERQPVSEKEDSKFKLAAPRLKIDLVSQPACDGGVG